MINHPKLETKQRVDPVLKLFFFILLLSGLFLLSVPFFGHQMPKVVHALDTLRGDYHGSEFIALPDQYAELGLSDETKGYRFTLKEDPMSFHFIPAVDHIYTSSAEVEGGFDVRLDLYKIEENKSIFIDSTARYPYAPYKNAGLDASYKKIPSHATFMKNKLEADTLYKVVFIAEDSAAMGKDAVVHIYRYDDSIPLAYLWMYLFGILFVLYALRVLLLLRKILKTEQQ